MMRTLAFALIAAALLAGGMEARAQEAAAAANKGAAAKPVVLDHVIGVINGDVLLQSDVDEEQRFAVLEPFTVPAGSDTLKHAARRLVSRTLILQQMKEQQQFGIKVTDEQVKQALTDLRSHLPTCQRYHCATDAGWKAFLYANDLTEAEVNIRFRQRLTILSFIDLRFRSGIRIPKEEITAYYQKSILPAYAQSKEKPPTVETLTPRIQELLLQQHVNELLLDWLKSLREEGSVQIVDSAYGPSDQGDDDEDNE